MTTNGNNKDIEIVRGALVYSKTHFATEAKNDEGAPCQTRSARHRYNATQSMHFQNALEALTRIESALAEREWQPISTAPRDGSHILLYRPIIQFTGYYGGENSGWRINAPDLPAMWPLPTLWMPQPQPPKGEK